MILYGMWVPVAVRACCTLLDSVYLYLNMIWVWLLSAGIIGGAVLILLLIILILMFAVYRMRKKDEGSYSLDEPRHSFSYTRAKDQEFFAWRHTHMRLSDCITAWGGRPLFARYLQEFVFQCPSCLNLQLLWLPLPEFHPSDVYTHCILPQS